MQQQKPLPPTSIFCVAAPCDATLQAQWERHLLPLEQAGYITVWSEHHLLAGSPRIEQMHDHLEQADLLVLLLSADFFASDECIALMERALCRHQDGEARLIPLLLRPVSWRESQLASLSCIPSNQMPVTEWANQDAAFDECVREIRRILGRPTTSAQIAQQATPLSALQNQNRVRMLRRLRHSYNEMMSQSLQGVAWLELGLTARPDAVQNATNLLLRTSNHTEQALPPGTSITKVYDEAEHELLILGEPGAGKSTLLLDLAQQLVKRVEQDVTHPLPVILPLSSWAVKRPPLQDWIAEQLAEIYDVPRKLSTQWVQADEILPLLDGLDEMEENARPACIAAINTYHRNHLAALVVCSRTTEYEKNWSAIPKINSLAFAGVKIDEN